MALCVDCGGCLPADSTADSTSSISSMPPAGPATSAAGAASAAAALLPRAPSLHGGSEGAVEADPSARYIRYPLELGRGACKRVYKAFDLQEGIEVAWNKAELGLHVDGDARERIFAEIKVLQSLKHRNIIQCMAWWHDPDTHTINFITELFTSGTLRQFRKKHARHISEAAVKRWAFQILEGLLYLHAHSPPILHRDLKCDNILVNGSSGQVKIADLGLASCQRGSSVVGTPEFMAPEMYEESYDEKVDIYAFGMCMLELATLEYPYSECRSIPAIFRRVSQGIPPAALSKVASASLAALIRKCISPDPRQRPGALQLLKDGFFAELAERPGSPRVLQAASASRACTGGCITPPFGSCGNLLALPSGTIPHHVAHSGARATYSAGLQQQVRRCSSNGSNGSGCGEASAGLSSSRSICIGALGGAAGVRQAGAAGDQLATSPRAAASAQQQQAPASGPQAGQAGALWPAAAGGVGAGRLRGTTVCVAVVCRSQTTDEGEAEDSDDEVCVPLESVLLPHPEDLLPVEHDCSLLPAGGPLSHAGSCVATLPQWAESLAGLMQGGWDASEATLAAAAAAAASSPGNIAVMSGLLQRLSSQAGALHEQHQQQRQSSARCSSCCGTRPQAAARQLAAWQARLLARPRRLPGSSQQGSQRHSLTDTANRRQLQPPTCQQRQQQQRQRRREACSGPQMPVAAPRPAIFSPCSASCGGGDDGSSGSTCTGPQDDPGTEAAAQLLRRLSTLSYGGGSVSARQAVAGTLAAAGLLTVAPGCFMPTPPLLEKLLQARAQQATPAAAPAAGVGAGSSRRAGSAGRQGAAAGSGVPHRPRHGRTASSGAVGAAVLPAATPLAVPGGPPRPCSCESGVSRAARPASAIGTGLAAAAQPAAVPLAAQPAAAATSPGAAAAAAGSDGGPSVAPPAGGFGHILVRRRFVRAAQQSQQQPKVFRSHTL